jgi:F-type H+-transporting ATPase subunit epsilon
MADKVVFELVSPERLLISESVDMVVVPGSEGNFGVLPGHAPLISTIRPGVIEIYAGRQVVNRIFIAGGFAEVTPERLTVLAEEAMPLTDLQRGAIDQALKDAAEDVADAKSPEQKAAGERRLRIAEAKRDALLGKGVH